jgi:hypothetical protein
LKLVSPQEKAGRRSSQAARFFHFQHRRFSPQLPFAQNNVYTPVKQWYSRRAMRSQLQQRRCLRIALALCALAFATTSFSQQPKIKLVHATSDHSLWRVNLKSQGYPANSDELQRRRGFGNFDTISFIGDNVLAATFITREKIPALQRRDDPNHVRPYRLHALFLDALTGKTLHTIEWPIDDPNAGVFPRHDGGFLLVTSEKIASYSADWADLKEIQFSGLHSMTATLSGIAESPNAKYVVIQFLTGNSSVCSRISTDTLNAVPANCGVLEVFTVSDYKIVEPEKLPGENEERENIPSHAYAQRSSAARAGETICNPCAGIPQFINDDAMAVYSPEKISVLDGEGKVTFTQNFIPRERWIDELGRPVRASANGQRFAIVTNRSPFARNARSGAIHISTGDIPAEMPLDIEVFDLSAAQWIYTLRINDENLHQIWGLALSPNAKKLAIDSGGTIQIYTLP